MDLILLSLVFSLILTVASRLLHPYSTDDKTSVNDEKILHSGGHPERFTELHGEENWEEGDRGDQGEKRGNQKGREQSSQLAIPYVLSTVWNTQRGLQSYMVKIRGRRKIEMTRRSRREVKRREIDLAGNLFLKSSPQPRTPREIHRVK